MNLRHIDPRSTDWMDAMLEGEGGQTRKREPHEKVVDTQGIDNPALLLQAEAASDRESPRSPPPLRR